MSYLQPLIWKCTERLIPIVRNVSRGRQTVLWETFIRCVHTGTLMCISVSLYVIVCSHIASGSDEVSQVQVVCDTLLVYMIWIQVRCVFYIFQ